MTTAVTPNGACAFPLTSSAAVRAALGDDYPLGYRFIADEYVPGRLDPGRHRALRQALAQLGVAYLSVMAGCYDSFALPGYLADDRREAFMVPVCARDQAGRSCDPGHSRRPHPRPGHRRGRASRWQGGSGWFGRVLFADPLWPRKARGEIAEPINPCQPSCTLCTRRIVEQKPAYCACWPEERRGSFSSAWAADHFEDEEVVSGDQARVDNPALEVGQRAGRPGLPASRQG